MGVLHFLNVDDGDCSVIQHPSGRVTVIDVNNASPTVSKAILEALGVHGDFRQKDHPVNPIEYLGNREVRSVHRFILTHPDMDHMGGIKAFFDAFSPINFWDSDNEEEKEFETGSPHNEEDWDFYRNIRVTDPNSEPKRLTLLDRMVGCYWNKDEGSSSGGDGLHILSPTADLLNRANESGDFNDCSYVILYRSAAGTTLFPGDAQNATWDHLLSHHKSDIADVDLLIAPHHGRRSDLDFSFLDAVKPKLTFFGNAPSEHLAYDAWNNRKLPFITNNQANCIVVDTSGTTMSLYVTNESFARSLNANTFWSDQFRAFYCLEF